MFCCYQFQVRLFLIQRIFRAASIFLPHLIRGQQLIANFGNIEAIFCIHYTAGICYLFKTDLFLQLDESLLGFNQRFLRLTNLDRRLLLLEFKVNLCLLQARLRGSQIGFSLLQTNLDVGGFNDGDDLILLNVIACINPEVQNLSARFGTNFNNIQRLDGPGCVNCYGDVAPFNHCSLHFCRFSTVCSVCVRKDDTPHGDSGDYQDDCTDNCNNFPFS